MKRITTVFCCVSVFMSVLFSSVPVYAAGTAQTAAVWKENNFDVQVFKGTIRDNMYSIYYNNIDTEDVTIGENVYLLMVNGGFFPNAGIILKNDRTLVPAETACEILGMKMEWNETEQTITIYNDAVNITLAIDSYQAIVNGKAEPIDAAAEIVNSKIYIPVRFVAEAANAKVQCIPNINKLSKAGGVSRDQGTYNDYVDKVKTVVIETERDYTVMYTVEDGLTATKLASEKEYQELLDYYKLTNAKFDNNFKKDYDPDAIEYTNFDLGRYYVYQLQGFPNFPIFFNKYTGEIFSRKAGLPGVFVTEGFINVSWLYQ